MSAVDLAQEVADFLLRQESIQALTGERIYTDDLPGSLRKVTAARAPYCCYVTGLGGQPKVGRSNKSSGRIDVFSFGPGFTAARRLDRLVYAALDDLSGEYPLYAAEPSGYYRTRHPDTLWEGVFSIYAVYYYDRLEEA